MSGTCVEHQDTDEAQRQLEEAMLAQRMDNIRQKIVVMSGKGGVGKSTVAANLAVGLSQAGMSVGLLDVDVHGPSIPQLLGMQGQGTHLIEHELQVVRINDRLSVMSIGFLMTSPTDAVIWRGPRKYALIRQFLKDVNWGRLDYLVIDSPPGTGDEPLAVAQLVGTPAMAVLVTTPQELAVNDVRRSVSFCRAVELPVLGIIENMSGFVCPRCGHHVDIFKTGGGEALAKESNVSFLGKVPLDPTVDRLHGGVIAMLLDAGMTHCLFARKVAGLTAKLNIRYNQGVMLGISAMVRARVVDSEEPLYYLEAEVLQNGHICAAAKATFWNSAHGEPIEGIASESAETSDHCSPSASQTRRRSL